MPPTAMLMKKKSLTVVAIVGSLLAVAVICGFLVFRANYVKIGGEYYSRSVTALDLKNSGIEDISGLDGLNQALNWPKTADADNLMYGEPSGDEFDIMVGEMRRPMLIASVE